MLTKLAELQVNLDNYWIVYMKYSKYFLKSKLIVFNCNLNQCTAAACVSKYGKLLKSSRILYFFSLRETHYVLYGRDNTSYNFYNYNVINRINIVKSAVNTLTRVHKYNMIANNIIWNFPFHRFHIFFIFLIIWTTSLL